MYIYIYISLSLYIYIYIHQILADVTATGANAYSSLLAADTDAASWTHIVVYTKSTLVEQTTPQAVAISDDDSSVSSAALVDADLDATQLGGSVTWTAPATTSSVTHYTVYLAESGAGASKSQIGGAVAVGTNAGSAFADAAEGSFTHAVVSTDGIGSPLPKPKHLVS